MFPSSRRFNKCSNRLPQRQGGSVLLVGIFVLTVMFLLAAALIRIVSSADEALTQEVWGTRALATANSGADLAMSQLFPLAGGSPGCAAVAPQWSPPNETGFHGCSVSLDCQAYTADGVTQYLLVSSAVCESGELRVSRAVEVSAREMD